MLYNLCIHYWILDIYFYILKIFELKYYDLKSFLKNFFEKWQTTRKEELFLSVFITFHDISSPKNIMLQFATRYQRHDQPWGNLFLILFKEIWWWNSIDDGIIAFFICFKRIILKDSQKYKLKMLLKLSIISYIYRIIIYSIYLWKNKKIFFLKEKERKYLYIFSQITQFQTIFSPKERKFKGGYQIDNFQI